MVSELLNGLGEPGIRVFVSNLIAAKQIVREDAQVVVAVGENVVGVAADDLFTGIGVAVDPTAYVAWDGLEVRIDPVFGFEP